MNRQSTLIKERVAIKEFQRLLRSGKDFSANSMYSDAGKLVFLEGETVGNIVRDHYRKIIRENKSMYDFVKEHSELSFRCLMEQFALKFKVCKRESRFMIKYIRYMKEPQAEITDIINDVYGKDMLNQKSESAKGKFVDPKQKLIEMTGLKMKEPDYKFTNNE